MPYKRDAFFVTSGGDVFIPYFKDKNNTYNLGEAVYNLEQRPQPVQSDWNEGDESSLAYIKNKPDLNQYATKEELSTKQDTLISGSNIKTINGQDILGSGDIVISSGDKPYEEQYLTIETLEENCTINFEGNDIQYSINDGSWNAFTQDLNLNFQNTGFKIRFKQTGLTPDSSKGIGKFKVSKKFKVYGNIMSLYYGDDFIGQTDLTGKDYAFKALFYECANLINAENLILPATTLSPYCYYDMFSLCTSLTKTPKLPATTLAQECYRYMFSGCYSLTKAPELPATQLAYSCYSSMFKYCTRLTKAPELPATTLAEWCYANMFYECSSLTKAPELPAKTLVEGCYYDMFYTCQNLNYVKCLATDISANNATYLWLTASSSTGTFITADNPPAWSSNSSGIPSGWTSYTESQYEEVRHYELANKVSSTTENMKIEVVNALPETPAENTIYVIV